MAGRDEIEARLRGLLADVLALPPARAAQLGPASPLFGALPELDSMAVANLLTEIEDRFGILIDDDEVDVDMMATFGSLTGYVAAKASGA